MTEMRAGTVYWITGLAGAGKSSVGRELAGMLKARGRSVAFLDGDSLREAFGNDLGHSREERLKSAMRNARLCKLLADQGIDAVCATISLFSECHRWNRENLKQYVEIYLRAPMQLLQQRDQKGLYSGAQAGRLGDVVGIDMQFDEPREAHVVIDNDGSQTPAQVAERIFKGAFRE